MDNDSRDSKAEANVGGCSRLLLEIGQNIDIYRCSVNARMPDSMVG